jgi:hypothetical protein
VLADPGGDDERVQPVERRRHRAHGRSDAVGEDIEREPGRRVAGGLELAHVAGDPR